MKIVADSHIPFIRDYFGAYGELVLCPGREITRDDVKNADVLLVRSITHVDQKLLDGSRVKFVGSVTAGADHLDTRWLDDAGISWSVAAGFNAPPVADYVMSVVAALQKKKLLGEKNLKAAVIGVGNVGRQVVERLGLLDCEIILCDPVRAQQEPDFSSVPMEELCGLDMISLHVPLVRSGQFPTHHFVGKEFLLRQKPGCVLLNASRGAVVNSGELLQHGRHMHWCFDVWEHEPKIDKSVLEQSFIATPHIAGYSVQSKIRGIDMIYRIACELGIIIPQVISPIEMPKQTLTFAGEQHHWRDVVLGIFNPLVVTEMTRTILMPAEEYGALFDKMRNQFNYRHEFGYTHIVDTAFSSFDRRLLEKLGLTLE
ncbi:Erythronate-4-phosphate dehydrogenase [Aquicella siphonis]|uniref:Erythronate-4-phosphate dehydrogenase n=1 Tax=Aquicella siphonis TaxID=254247 RepID=A0A5E4PJS3_9COXI|nr:4-phosphoerythronate dehydrogenase [Aquicella siphonis]VVC76663.1 Erythronate-4-phosphate dehydrogenase [Aquicella siphonis]